MCVCLCVSRAAKHILHVCVYTLYVRRTATGRQPIPRNTNASSTERRHRAKWFPGITSPIGYTGFHCVCLMRWWFQYTIDRRRLDQRSVESTGPHCVWCQLMCALRHTINAWSIPRSIPVEYGSHDLFSSYFFPYLQTFQCNEQVGARRPDIYCCETMIWHFNLSWKLLSLIPKSLISSPIYVVKFFLYLKWLGIYFFVIWFYETKHNTHKIILS